MDETELKQAYTKAKREAREWQKEYPEYERLANNELLADLDENLPETNDGSLAAALFKLPKRVVPKDLSGAPRALDRDDEWINEFARIEWEKNIVPNANTQAPFERKWKDAVRKAAIYGAVPLITLITERGNYNGADFIVAYPQDVALEPGKVSDYDSDVIYWDIYFTDSQIKQLIKNYKAEAKAAKAEGRESYNTWNLEGLKALLKDAGEQERETQDSPKGLTDRAVKRGGKKVTMCFNRGVGSMFYGYAPSIDKVVREYPNPDPTGDIPVHYLYCYQDFVNPYGIGIVKLAGGTQNVLDYMRQADVLATQIGIRPPVLITGDTSETDLESMVYAQDALWFAGKAQVARQELGNNVYSELPNRMSMYKSSLNALAPMGDTTVSATAGDPLQSKTPAGVKQAQMSLSIDDEDFKDNLFITYEAVAKSMINTHFANKQGSDIVRLNESERERIFKSAPELFPQFQEQVDPESGEVIPPSSELEVIWDNARAEFDFTVDAEPDKMADDKEKLDGYMRVLELTNADPNFVMELQASGKKFNKGELLADIVSLLSDNDKIITDISPEEAQQIEAEQMAQQQAMQAEAPQEQAVDFGAEQPVENQEDPAAANVQAVAQKYGVDEGTAALALHYEHLGYPSQQIEQFLMSQGQVNA